MSPLAFLDIGFSEMLVVAFVALILFGGRLPEVMRSLGASYRSFRRGMEDMTRQVSRPDLGLKPPAVPYRPTPPAPPTPTAPPRPTPAAGTPSPNASSTPTGNPQAAGVEPAKPSPRAPIEPPVVQAPRAPPAGETPRPPTDDDTQHV